jgi:hypothetical protein
MTIDVRTLADAILAVSITDLDWHTGELVKGEDESALALARLIGAEYNRLAGPQVSEQSLIGRTQLAVVVEGLRAKYTQAAHIGDDALDVLDDVLSVLDAPVRAQDLRGIAPEQRGRSDADGRT